jgi:HSP20 family protein
MTLIRFRNPDTVYPESHNHFRTFDSLLDEMFSGSSREVKHTKVLTNVMESAEQYTIEIAAPGFEKSEISIDLDNVNLRIAGKHEENKEDGIDYKSLEFNFNEFEKTYELPENADYEKISAEYSNGILKVRIPKKEEAQKQSPRQISIA